jgi:antitoxin (DNA-binding transcriptional repressor) of toxin-antitoxin stability system
MKNTLTATELARNVGDILARVRYRGESFVIERNGRLVARIVPTGPVSAGTVRDGLSAWVAAAGGDSSFGDDLEAIDAVEYPPDGRWDS